MVSIFPDSAACVLSFYHSTPLHLKTLDFSFSGTFPQTLPELVTPLKGQSILYLCAGVHRRCQRLPKGLGTTDKTVKATQLPSTHVNMRRVRPGTQVSSVSIKTILVLFVTAKAMWAVIKETPDIIQSKLFVTNLLLFEHQRKSVCHLRPTGNQLWRWLEEGCCKPVLGVCSHWLSQTPLSEPTDWLLLGCFLLLVTECICTLCLCTYCALYVTLSVSTILAFSSLSVEEDYDVI